MKQISIISAKGGVGKTSISAAFASLAKQSVLVDCDTETTDLKMLLTAVSEKEQEVDTLRRSYIEEDECIRCGLCKALCHFDAVSNTLGVYQINEEHCQACDLCLKACPVSAIGHIEAASNKWGEAHGRFGKILYAQLALGEDLNGSLINILRERAIEIAEEEKQELVLIDGPPAMGFAMASAISNTDVAVVVVEPGPSAIYDLHKSQQLAKRYETMPVCLINKSDLNPQMRQELIVYCKENKIPIIGEIPFDAQFLEAQLASKSIIEYAPDSSISKLLKQYFEAVL